MSSMRGSRVASGIATRVIIVPVRIASIATASISVSIRHLAVVDEFVLLVK